MKCVLLTFLCAQQSAACACHAVCTSISNISATIMESAGGLAGDTLTICKNTECASAVLGDLSGSGSDIELAGDFSAEAMFAPDGSDTSVNVELFGVGPYDDGDVYRIEVSTPDAMTLIDRSGSAEYQQHSICSTTCSELTLQL